MSIYNYLGHVQHPVRGTCTNFATVGYVSYGFMTPRSRADSDGSQIGAERFRSEDTMGPNRARFLPQFSPFRLRPERSATTRLRGTGGRGLSRFHAAAPGHAARTADLPVADGVYCLGLPAPSTGRAPCGYPPATLRGLMTPQRGGPRLDPGAARWCCVRGGRYLVMR